MSNSAKIREKALLLNPIDDLMFKKMAEDKAFCQEILQVLLEDPGLVVVENRPQWAGTNLQGRSVILDALCRLGSGVETDIEVQKSDDENHQKRVRYNGAVLTANITDPGTRCSVHFQDGLFQTEPCRLPCGPYPPGDRRAGGERLHGSLCECDCEG